MKYNIFEVLEFPEGTKIKIDDTTLEVKKDEEDSYLIFPNGEEVVLTNSLLYEEFEVEDNQIEMNNTNEIKTKLKELINQEVTEKKDSILKLIYELNLLEVETLENAGKISEKGPITKYCNAYSSLKESFEKIKFNQKRVLEILGD